MFNTISVDFIAVDAVYNCCRAVTELSTSERTVKRTFFYAMPPNPAETDMVEYFNRVRATAEYEAIQLFEMDAPGAEGLLKPTQPAALNPSINEEDLEIDEEDILDEEEVAELDEEDVQEMEVVAPPPPPPAKKATAKAKTSTAKAAAPVKEATKPEPTKAAAPVKEATKKKVVETVYSRENTEHKKLCAEIITAAFGAGWTKDANKKAAGLFLSEKLDGKIKLVDGQFKPEDIDQAKKVLAAKLKALTK